MAFMAPLAAMGLPALLSTGLAAGGAILGGINAINQGKYQNAVAKNNAIIAEQNANAESQRSQVMQKRADRETAELVASQLATQAASGFDVLGRTQTRTRNMQRKVGRESAFDIRAEGTAAARRLMQDAANFRTEGKNAKRQGLITGIGQFLQAGSSIASAVGGTGSLATSRMGGRRPWDTGGRNWYGP